MTKTGERERAAWHDPFPIMRNLLLLVGLLRGPRRDPKGARTMAGNDGMVNYETVEA